MLAVGCAAILDAHRGPTAGATELLCSGFSFFPRSVAASLLPRLPEPSQAKPLVLCCPVNKAAVATIRSVVHHLLGGPTDCEQACSGVLIWTSRPGDQVIREDRAQHESIAGAPKNRQPLLK